ncbi:hypothetical protein BDE02_08G183900 [Populus trichocarpa]|nr:hypothetical protein BDE02_08G183900 [Populus trichocarpa]
MSPVLKLRMSCQENILPSLRHQYCKRPKDLHEVMASFLLYSTSLISLLSLPLEADIFVMRRRDSFGGNFASSNSFHFQVAESNNYSDAVIHIEFFM